MFWFACIMCAKPLLNDFKPSSNQKPSSFWIFKFGQNVCSNNIIAHTKSVSKVVKSFVRSENYKQSSRKQIRSIQFLWVLCECLLPSFVHKILWCDTEKVFIAKPGLQFCLVSFRTVQYDILTAILSKWCFVSTDLEESREEPLSYQPKMNMQRFQQFLEAEERNNTLSTISGQAGMSHLGYLNPGAAVHSSHLPDQTNNTNKGGWSSLGCMLM